VEALAHWGLLRQKQTNKGKASFKGQKQSQMRNIVKTLPLLGWSAA